MYQKRKIRAEKTKTIKKKSWLKSESTGKLGVMKKHF